MIAFLVLMACGTDADLQQQPPPDQGQPPPGGPGQPPPGGPGQPPPPGGPGGQPPPGGPGEPPAPGGQGAPPPRPGPVADEPATPATWKGGAPTMLVAEAKQPWAVLGDASGLTWWNRSTGETQPVEHKGAWPAGTACDLAPDGALICISGGHWVVSAPPGATSTSGPAGKAPGGRPIVSPDGAWIAVSGEATTVVARDGKQAWAEPGAAVAAGWFGDSLRVGKDGKVREIDPEHGTVSDVGSLPAGVTAWWPGPDGTWAGEKEGRLLLYGPGLFAIPDAVPPSVKLPDGVTAVAWLDSERFVAITPQGVHLWAGQRPVPLTGELGGNKDAFAP